MINGNALSAMFFSLICSRNGKKPKTTSLSYSQWRQRMNKIRFGCSGFRIAPKGRGIRMIENATSRQEAKWSRSLILTKTSFFPGVNRFCVIQ